MLNAAIGVNNRQPERLIGMLGSKLNLTLKPGSDDLWHSRSILLMERLHVRNTNIVAYDPVITENMREQFSDIEYADSVADALAALRRVSSTD